jgi:hypothetical protein
MYSKWSVDIGPLMQWKIDGARPLRSEIEKNSPATRHYWFLWDSLLLQYGLLFKEYMKGNVTGYHYQFLTQSLALVPIYQ